MRHRGEALAAIGYLLKRAVIDVGEWYVANGGHDRAGKDQLGHASAVLRRLELDAKATQPWRFVVPST